MISQANVIHEGILHVVNTVSYTWNAIEEHLIRKVTFLEVLQYGATDIVTQDVEAAKDYCKEQNNSEPPEFLHYYKLLEFRILLEFDGHV